ncbi:MAG: family 43 glycosylhydrolase [Pontiellaceae bacterium]|nr:family 43 glycosylhydrolase [Pontiellaceae bacterium]
MFIKCSRFIVIMWLALVGVSRAADEQTSIHPGEVWTDTEGKPINAHGGGMLIHDNTYYWFGEIKGRGATALEGISCYSSTNLLDWTSEGLALAVEQNAESEIQPGSIMERPKVIYNEKTKKFVLWFHLELKGKGYDAARTGVAVSDKVAGPYTYLRSYRPNAGVWPQNVPEKFREEGGDEFMKYLRRDLEGGQMSRDMTLFVDDDGTAYHIHAAEENYTLNISQLSEDYTSFTKQWTRVLPGGHNEAPAIFKHGEKYYMITSGCTGWDPNAARLHSADSLLGEWTALGNPCKGEDANLTFHSQSTYVLPVQGKENAYIFMADRWKPRNLGDSRYIWLPVQFKDDQPYLEWADEWDFSVFDR